MRERPILFNAEMVKAILDGRKTCTRRLVNFLPGKNPQWTGYIKDGLILYNGKNEPCIRKAPYQLGDVLYVRETWGWCPCWDCGMDAVPGECKHEKDKLYNNSKKGYGCYLYRASCEDNEYPAADTWHPSINMPKKAARIWLQVTEVRVERLQDITEAGAAKEGCIDDIEYAKGKSARSHFIGLWNSTIKKSDVDIYGWSANPWVWVIEFGRCGKPGKG